MERLVAGARVFAFRFATAWAPIAALACSSPSPDERPAPTPSKGPAADPASAPAPAGKPPDAAASPPAAPAFAWYSELGDTVVAKCDAILVGKVGAISELRGGAIVRVDVSTWYYGDRTADATSVTLLANPDDFFIGTELLLFLKKFESGERYTYVNRIIKSDSDFEPKRKVLEQTLALRAIARDDDRRREVRRRIYEDAGSTEMWTRSHVLREIAWLRAKWPDVLSREDFNDLRELARRSSDEKWKKALLAALADKEGNS
jgi:hypothetical protein